MARVSIYRIQAHCVMYAAAERPKPCRVGHEEPGNLLHGHAQAPAGSVYREERKRLFVSGKAGYRTGLEGFCRPSRVEAWCRCRW